MPTYNITIDDASPVWKYIGGWQDTGDLSANRDKYSQKTFHVTNARGAHATMKFNGTAITVYGSQSTNHSTYAASVDNKGGEFDGFSEQTQFQVPLFAAGGLSATDEHNVFLADMTSGEVSTRQQFDIDHAIITVGDGNTATGYSSVTIDDTAPANFSYSGDWQMGSRLKDLYFNSTSHVTNALGAAAKINFYGNAIIIYGAVSDHNGPYTARLDDGPTEEYSGFSTTFCAQAVLAQWTNLPLGSHSVLITHTSESPNIYFNLDSALVLRSTLSVFSSPTSADSTTQSSASAASNSTVPTSSTDNAAVSIRKAENGVALSAILGIFILLTFFVGIPSCLLSRPQPRKKYTGTGTGANIVSSP